ncbi:ATP-dependent DNA ligase [Arthrobacter sp. JSM 101049]|uniref:ATP-dependent DNA ligase n=1 Tax=Arthrobacter sp. JSM 101049 TaxID=929097 RepID=UPI0035612F33
MSPRANEQLVDVSGRRLKVSNLDKVLYPETGTTKADVLRYLAGVAHVLIPQAAWRPVTRKRWVHGVGTADKPGQVFFRKDLEDSAPEWIPRVEFKHKDHTNIYPLANEPGVLAWFGQLAALELHVPQWRFTPQGQQGTPDRLVLDLDPGEGAGLPECAETALLCRDLLADMGLDSVPVTSGSKGIHLYAPLDGSYTSAQVSEVAHELARALEADHPQLVVSDMKKSLRTGKVLVDWSQNNGAKTTICPYSLRGRSHPTVAAPRTWEEIEDPKLRHLDYQEVLERVDDGLDPLAGQAWTGSTTPDRLEKYRSMRDASKTPEPVPAEPASARDGEPSFVIQEHHATRLHWDFRLEHSGVLVSWAVPKGPPLDSGQNRLAVMTEDHPLDYGSFEGTIPKGEYGAGEVTIWDAGTCDLEKWREGKEVIAVLHGRPDGGLGGVPRRYALVNAPGMGDEKNWLIHLTKDQPEPGDAEGAPKTTEATTTPEDTGSRRKATGRGSGRTSTARAADAAPDTGDLPAPMLATKGTTADLDSADDWAYEMKWDGIRAIAGVYGGRVALASRNGNDLTAAYPELQELAGLAGDGAVLDGEIVALDASGRPDFGRLQQRMNLTRRREIEAIAAKVPVHYMVFDALRLPASQDGNGDGDVRQLMRSPYAERREAMFDAVTEGEHIHLPVAHTGSLAEAIGTSRELRLEGIVAKKTDGRYVPGKHSRGWVKIKHESHQEVVVIGWRAGGGSRQGTVGSLLLAVNDDGALHYAGRVGTGFSADELDEAKARLGRITRKTPAVDDVPTADRRDVSWVSPKLVGEVRFSEVTGDGRLRHPVWRGWRPDKDPGDVHWE